MCTDARQARLASTNTVTAQHRVRAVLLLSRQRAKYPQRCSSARSLEEPEPDETITTGNDAATQRVWFRVRLRDVWFRVRLRVPERVALKLSTCSDLKAFIERHAASNLNWPLLCHVRVSRTVREVESGVYVNHMLEEVMPVSYTIAEAPNKAYLDLLQLVNKCPAHEESILFAFLSDIAEHEHYGFQVLYDGVPASRCTYVLSLIASTSMSTMSRACRRCLLSEQEHYGFQVLYDGVPASRCTYVLSLIASTSKSTTTNVGGGYQVKSSSIHDYAKPSAGVAQPSSDGACEPTYSVLGFCTLDDLPAFQLNPPIGKANRCAVCVISRREGNTFHVHKLECLEPAQMDTAVTCFQKMRKLCSAVRPSSTEKRSHDVKACAEDFPKTEKRAKTLKAVPTDASLE